jgi:TonB family protein
MAAEEKQLRELLTSEAARERRAWKRSSLLVGIIALGGLLWLAFTAYNVIRLQREASTLSTHIQEKTIELNELQTKSDTTKAELDEMNGQLKLAAEALAVAKAELETIAKTSQVATTKAQAQKALSVVNKASKDIKSALSVPALVPAPIPYGEPARRSTPPPERSPTSTNEPFDYNKVFTAKEVSQPARLLSKPLPLYTEEARKNNVAGTVRLRVVLAASGKVTSMTVLRGLPDGLSERALVAARQIKFEPAIKDGRAVSQYITLDYEFVLR